MPPIQSAKKPAQPKESKPKTKEEPKKVAKSEPEKPKEEAEEEAPKPKPKNPLDLLPPSKMVLDDWKRLYSNTKTNFREVAVKGFWDMYDPEGYSLWFCDYKYNDENTVSFVTLNKVGGFLQRMDLARKYAFGKMLVIGSEPPFKVKGLWLFRGQEIPKFVMDECYDMELYEWTKVDISDEAQKERASQMIEDAEPFEGEALLDAKCFK
jgi:elongation factor 1-gamma